MSWVFISSRHVDLRENKTISIQPIWVLRIEGQKFVEENMGSRSQSHGCAGMAGIGLEGGIDLCNGDRISLKASRICIELCFKSRSRTQLGSEFVIDEAVKLEDGGGGAPLTAKRRIVLIASSSSSLYPMMTGKYSIEDLNRELE